jgi:alpha-tubulin suppressor-like RCC1 family protein
MNIKRTLIQLGFALAAGLSTFVSEAQPVTMVAGGYGHSFFLKSDGSLWAMGFNNDGQLGDGGSEEATNLPVRIATANVTAVAAGEFHSLFITNGGALWAMGFNNDGQLGDGLGEFFTNRPELIVASNVTAASAGGSHSLFITNGGALWAMGQDGFGQLGDGLKESFTNRPELIVPSGVIAVAAGFQHSLFLKSDGSLWGMGFNLDGQLGTGTFPTSPPYGTNSPEEIVPDNVTAIAAGDSFSLFLKTDGSLWGMGNNDAGQLGDGTTNNVAAPEEIVASNVVAIAAGEYFSLFLKADGSLWGMGDDVYGQLGDGIFATNAPYGTNQPEQLVAGNVKAFAAGYVHSLFAKNDGSFWGMGFDGYGELGDGVSYASFSSQNATNRPEENLAAFNQVAVQPTSGGTLQFSYVGLAGGDYGLDSSPDLAQPNWSPVLTNAANSFGALIFTNISVPATNQFWRIRLTQPIGFPTGSGNPGGTF